MVERLKKNYDHTFKHLLETRWPIFFMFKNWVAENPEIGIQLILSVEKNKDARICMVTCLPSKVEKWPVSQEYHYRWRKTSLLFNTKSCALDKDESIQPNLKAEFHGRKVMLRVWRDHRDIIHFEFLIRNQTLNTDLQSKQPCTKIF